MLKSERKIDHIEMKIIMTKMYFSNIWLDLKKMIIYILDHLCVNI